MRKRIGLLILDVASAVLLGLGVAILLLPFVLYLTLGADNDAYIEIAEWAGGKRNVLAHLELVWMFGLEYLVLSAVPIIIGLVLRWLLWRSFAPLSQSPQEAEMGHVSEARV